ncbi:MAG TPA: hypothetical protein VGY48_14620 [Vicinamibacterales bacterium]|jgi:hypothetical protein|nr:hypothetical protein [Vicinamibacterales bacterium]
MPAKRTHSISSKVTADEYAQLAARAGAQPMSEWTRETLLRGGRPDPAAHAALAELVALRTVLLNVHFAIANGQVLTVERMQALIDRAEQDKGPKAQQLLAAAIGGAR